MKTLFVISLLAVSVLSSSCGKPAAEDKAKMHENAKRVSDSIEKSIDEALNSVSIAPQPPVQAARPDTTKK